MRPGLFRNGTSSAWRLVVPDHPSLVDSEWVAGKKCLYRITGGVQDQPGYLPRMELMMPETKEEM